MAKKSEFELDVEEKAWHLLSLLLKTGHPLLPQHLSSQCRLFSASPSFIAHVISLPSSPLSFTDNGLVAPSASAVFALGRFFSLTTAPIGFRDLEPIVLRKRKGTMDDLVELPLPAPKRTFFFSSLREQGGRDERRLAIIDQSYADAAKANRVGLIGSGTERGKQTPIGVDAGILFLEAIRAYFFLLRLSDVIFSNRLSVEELDAAPSNETVDCRSAFTTEEVIK
ncbi:hypothetical protein RIF29_18324 [Crotalaria pallida]|uniref:Uncharacterized protein n=1 Tax=Crotalaria pallida TaxID=3830 RepID=A0AAN9FSG4_CROPI